MTLRIRNFEGIQALDIVQLIKSREGTGWDNGVEPSLDDSASDIEIEVTSGEVKISDTSISVTNQSVTIPDGHSDWPRKDLIYVDSDGSLLIEEGTAREAQPEGQEGAGAYQPEVDDMSDIDGVAIAELWVPRNATSPDDIDESNHLRDRRVPV